MKKPGEKGGHLFQLRNFFCLPGIQAFHFGVQLLQICCCLLNLALKFGSFRFHSLQTVHPFLLCLLPCLFSLALFFGSSPAHPCIVSRKDALFFMVSSTEISACLGVYVSL